MMLDKTLITSFQRIRAWQSKDSTRNRSQLISIQTLKTDTEVEIGLRNIKRSITAARFVKTPAWSQTLKSSEDSPIITIIMSSVGMPLMMPLEVQV